MPKRDLRDVPPAPLVVAAGQAACSALDISANVAVAAELVSRAADRGAQVLVLPELFLTGYELEAIVEHPNRYTLGPADSRLDPLAAACSRMHVAVVVGAPAWDPDTGRTYIAALVLDRNGQVVAQYNKQHVDSCERSTGFAPGTSGCTIVLDGWNLGLAICWDSSYPEHARSAARDGCDAYLIGAMFPGERGTRKRSIVCAARAVDNAMYVVAANHIGRSGPYDGSGGSAVWDPMGAVLADAGDADPGIACGRLDPQVLTGARAEDFVLLDPSLTAPVQRRSCVLVD